eukprot:TRINITY_DN539_c0_g1_i1.p1 TRINITY_DN539_c0_g1~~TRINITY_DN539_c0_g1_i1.p1  ORF type:complete len:206 (+),score=100.09 TRINITY_DN539_c0_g1_i1:145-762(+)
MVFSKKIVIDCRGHILGRLASIIAKELLSGQHIVAVRCEEINISGPLYRNKVKFLSFLRKKSNVQPARRAFHYRSPAMILWRTIRGMLPHKTARGQAALNRLNVYVGVPGKYFTTKRLVCPEALRIYRLQPHRKYTVLGRLSKEMGWKHSEAVATLEAKRKVNSTIKYFANRAVLRLRKRAQNTVANKLKESGLAAALAKAGYRV